SELAKSMVGKLLERCGIKGQSGQKQYDVRKFLVERGLLIKQRNYCHDEVTGYRHGNFYICSLAVMFQDDVEIAPPNVASSLSHTTPPRIYSYLSPDEEEYGFSTEEWLKIVRRARFLFCEDRYWERRKRWQRGFGVAA